MAIFMLMVKTMVVLVKTMVVLVKMVKILVFKAGEFDLVGRIIVWTFIHEWIEETPSSRALTNNNSHDERPANSIVHNQHTWIHSSIKNIIMIFLATKTQMVPLCAGLRLGVGLLLCFVFWTHFDLKG